MHTVKESLEKIEVKWAKTKSLCVVLCSDGYPDNYKKNEEINNFDKIFLDDSNYLFHAGTKEVNKKIFAVGGRVLNFISLSETFHEARKNVHDNLKKLNQNTYDFVFYIAGVDIHHEDRLGKLKVTDEGINKRDQIVIENFYSKNIPLCGVLGGGYNKSFDKLIELHSMLHKNCAEYF